MVGHAESLRTGHYVEAQYVEAIFATNDGDARAAKGFGRTLHPRCNACRSIRRWHAHHENAQRRASAWRREHAARWVKHGRSPSTEAALTEMDIGGVTEEALTELILAAIDEDCPGMCADEINGRLVFHKIQSVAGLHIDVKDPSQPFTLENIGILCESCNPAKGDEPWAIFMFKRRAMLHAWREAISNPAYRRSEQMAFEI